MVDRDSFADFFKISIYIQGTKRDTASLQRHWETMGLVKFGRQIVAECRVILQWNQKILR